MAIISPPTSNLSQVYNGKMPNSNTAVPITINFSQYPNGVEVDLTLLSQLGVAKNIQSIFINNKDNTSQVTFYIRNSQQTISIPGGYQGYIPILCPGDTLFDVSSSGSATVVIHLLNFPTAASVWPAIGTTMDATAGNQVLQLAQETLSAAALGTPSDAAWNGSSGSATVIAALKAIYAHGGGSVQYTLTDGSSTITTGGTPQTLFGGTVPSHGYEVMNPHATETLYISDNGTTPAAESAGTIPILAGGSYTSPVNAAPGAVIKAVAATTGHAFTARYW